MIEKGEKDAAKVNQSEERCNNLAVYMLSFQRYFEHLVSVVMGFLGYEVIRLLFKRAMFKRHNSNLVTPIT